MKYWTIVETGRMCNLECRLQCWQRNYIRSFCWQEHQHNSSLASRLWYFHLIDRRVIARDALGRPPTAVAFPVSADGLKLSTWIVWPTWRTWWIREVDMVNQESWLRCALLWAMLCISSEAGFQAMRQAYQPANATKGILVCTNVCIQVFPFRDSHRLWASFEQPTKSLTYIILSNIKLSFLWRQKEAEEEKKTHWKLHPLCFSSHWLVIKSAVILSHFKYILTLIHVYNINHRV